MLRVVVEKRGELLRDEVFPGDLIVVGRDPACDLLLDDSFVSARHLVIRHDADARDFRLFDQSVNGTFYDDQRVSTLRFDAPTRIRIGNFALTLIPVRHSDTAEAPVDLYAPTVQERIPTEEARMPTMPHRQMPAPLIAGEVELRTSSVNGEVRTLVFAGSVLIGRSPECDLRFESREISRRHCMISPGESGYLVRRLSDRNPVEVNERSLAPGESMPLRDGDVIRLCDEELLFLHPATQSSRAAKMQLAREAAPNLDLVVTPRSCSDGSIRAFDVIGFLGVKTAQKFEEQMLMNVGMSGRVLVDLGYLVGIDSAGIATLGRVIRDAERRNVPIQLIRVTPRIADLIALSPLEPVLSGYISNTEDTAIRRLIA
ncbi:MAG: FHA domain-containing protein [Thermoanaerobaculia bacterium]